MSGPLPAGTREPTQRNRLATGLEILGSNWTVMIFWGAVTVPVAAGGGGLGSGGGGGGLDCTCGGGEAVGGRSPMRDRMTAALASASSRVPSCRACLEAGPPTPYTKR